MFTLVIVTLSTIVAILILTINFRHAHAYDMPCWFRKFFLYFLPRVLMYNPPGLRAMRRRCSGDSESDFSRDSLVVYQQIDHNSNNATYENLHLIEKPLITQQQITQALSDVRFISNKFKDDYEEDCKREEWEAVGRVLDRFFFYSFGAVIVLGTGSILGTAPALYDTTPKIG